MIRIVDYDAGNLASVSRALAYLGHESEITPDPDKIRRADRVIFPGDGHARSAMAVLRQRGLDIALREAFEAGTPIMGICLGTQIVLSRSEEGDTACLGLVEGDCRRFRLGDRSLKIPHMGWNALTVTRPHPLLRHVKPGDEFYFVHSFYPRPSDRSMVFATCEYETVFAAALGFRNLFATQFHPEKSGRIGVEMLRNFTEWDGAVC